MSVGRQAPRARKVRKALPGSPAQKVIRDSKGRLAHKVRLAKRAHLEREGHRARKGEAGVSGLRVVAGENVACNQDEVLVSIVCASGSADGARCPSGGNATALCMRK